MAYNIKKSMKIMETYKTYDIVKHKHDYTLKHLLIVTNINKHATANYYNKKEYYYVLKCKYCDSFIPLSVEGNYNHRIFNIEDIDNNLPIITANTLQKCPLYNFSKLIDVKINEKEEK